MTSIVDSKDINRHIAVLRGKATNGRVWSERGIHIEAGCELNKPIVHTMYCRVDDGADLERRFGFGGHRFGENRVCVGCGINLFAWLLYTEGRCSSASDPTVLHRMDLSTASCMGCGATYAEFQDGVVPERCPQSREALDKFIGEREAAVRGTYAKVIEARMKWIAARIEEAAADVPRESIFAIGLDGTRVEKLLR